MSLNPMSKLPFQHIHEPSLLNESESSNQIRGGSVRSSDGGGSFSGYEDIGDERARIERKIEQIKEKLTRISLAREADVDDFLSVTNNMAGGNENPQIARVRQHFEKKNKKHTQETESLQKKLEQFQARLLELSMGVNSEPSPRSAVLSNIRKTGPLLREVTGSVISAPLGIAHMIKNTFGSADNIPDSVENEGASVGHSTFYPNIISNDDRLRSYSTNQCQQQDLSDKSKLRLRTETVPAMPIDFTLQSTGVSEGKSPSPSVSLEGITELKDEIRELKQQNQQLLDQINKVQNQMQSEFKFYNSELHEERIKVQKLEEILNETIELHQAEVTTLKSDLNTIGTRMDYHYCDRFRSIEESIESTQNSVCSLFEVGIIQMIRLEEYVREWIETRPRSVLSSVMLVGANALVELLKLILFVVSFALDFIKPFTGTRSRAGFLIIFVFIAIILAQSVDFLELFRRFLSLFHKKHSEVILSTDSISVTSLDDDHA
ncbi:unnamed protein product [Anisakis simplex]|uniref:Uncharacterized protein n=1 Tax=Anisakis simplex TaxID=6269 RepID=A0A0M3JZL7_ANISI|nr:unnamed protein product [Anisakis simplex]